MTLAIALIIAIVFLAAVIFVPFVRSMLSGLLRFAFLLAVIFLAIAGSAILMNNETIFDRPSTKQRIIRFLAEDSAATSEKGYSEAPCVFDQPAAEQRAKEEAARARQEKKQEAPAATPNGQSTLQISAQPTASPTPSPDQIDANLYDELMTRNYICQLDTPVAIPRAKLLDMVQQTIAELKGWKLISTDPHSGVLDCVYTTQVIGTEDDVRIGVTPKSDVALCSQSKSSEPGSGSMVGFFPGDFGANIGHIKQFYAALKEKTDAYCTELEQKQKPKDSNR
jgi:hypothetical protein